MSTLHEDQNTFFFVKSYSFLAREMFQTNVCIEKHKTHFMLKNFFFSKIMPFRETWRTKCVRQLKFKRRAGMWADQSSTSDHVT
jgi:hypothetical protein